MDAGRLLDSGRTRGRVAHRAPVVDVTAGRTQMTLDAADTRAEDVEAAVKAADAAVARLALAHRGRVHGQGLVILVNMLAKARAAACSRLRALPPRHRVLRGLGTRGTPVIELQRLGTGGRARLPTPADVQAHGTAGGGLRRSARVRRYLSFPPDREEALILRLAPLAPRRCVSARIALTRLGGLEHLEPPVGRCGGRLFASTVADLFVNVFVEGRA